MALPKPPPPQQKRCEPVVGSKSSTRRGSRSPSRRLPRGPPTALFSPVRRVHPAARAKRTCLPQPARGAPPYPGSRRDLGGPLAYLRGPSPCAWRAGGANAAAPHSPRSGPCHAPPAASARLPARTPPSPAPANHRCHRPSEGAWLQRSPRVEPCRGTRGQQPGRR